MCTSSRLPIHIEDVESVTECWTYNRLAVIKTSPYSRDWIVSHYNLFVDINHYNFLFGEMSSYLMAYYKDILSYEHIPLHSVSESSIVEVLKERLRKEFYIIASLAYDEKSDYVHEVLLFGFDDDNEVFLSVELEQRKFTEHQIAYQYVKKAIGTIKRYFLNNGTAGMKLSLVFQYPITAIKLNPLFTPQHCPFEAYRKLVLETNSKDIIQNSFLNFEICDDRDYAYIITGVKCLKIFGQMLTEFMEDQIKSPWFKGVTNAAKKIQEHQMLVAETMEYLLEKWQDATTIQARRAVDEYKQAIGVLDKWTNMCLKFETNGEISLLKRICKEVDQIYEIEKRCLLTFVNDGFDWQKMNQYYI